MHSNYKELVLFLEELAQAVREQEGLGAGAAVPETLQAVLAARIDYLPAEAKDLLHMEAVIGTEVPLPLLAAIAERPEAVLHHSLAQLQAAEFLYATRLVPEPVYTFNPTTSLHLAFCLSSLSMSKICIVIALLYPCNQR
jgi:hypothetical protein